MLLKEKIRDLYYLVGEFINNLNVINEFRGVANIIAFHKIVSSEHQEFLYSSNSTPVELFKFLIEYLSKNYNIVSLDEISTAISKKYTINKGICITFDDGYNDFYTNAFPILKYYNIPAVLYITTSFIENSSNIWWLDLDRYILSCNDKDRLKTYRLIRNKIINKQRLEQNILLKEYGIDTKNSKYDMLTWQKVRELSESKLIQIGNHSHMHEYINTLNSYQFEQDVIVSQRKIYDNIGKISKHYCYPYGKKMQYNKRSQILNKYGFETGVTTEVYTITANTNKLELPRHTLHAKSITKKRIDIRLNGWSGFTKIQI